MTIEIIQTDVILEVSPQREAIEIPGGLPGRSAYEDARLRGYTGTLDEWLQSLQAVPNFLLRLSADESAIHFYTPAGVYLGSSTLLNLGMPDLDL